MAQPLFVIAGGSRGIGAAIAAKAAATGRPVLLSYAGNEAAATEVVDRIHANGGQATAVQADTGTEEGRARLFAAVDAAGSLDAFVYNSGITGAACPLGEVAPETVARVLDVNLLGAILCAREASLRMSSARGGQGGSITFLSSRAALFGSPGLHVWYAATKGGIDSLTIGLSRELGPEGIRVNAVSPGPIGTGMLTEGQIKAASEVTALRRLGTPDEVAAAVLFLASAEASYITGANLAVSGGR